MAGLPRHWQGRFCLDISFLLSLIGGIYNMIKECYLLRQTGHVDELLWVQWDKISSLGWKRILVVFRVIWLEKYGENCWRTPPLHLERSLFWLERMMSTAKTNKNPKCKKWEDTGTNSCTLWACVLSHVDLQTTWTEPTMSSVCEFYRQGTLSR